MDIIFNKLYRYDRQVPAYIAIPVKKGKLYNIDRVQVFDGDRVLPVQKKVTAAYEDGSVKYMFLRFPAELPANKGKVFKCEFDSDKTADEEVLNDIKLTCEREEGKIRVKSSCIEAVLADNTEHMFESVSCNGMMYGSGQFAGPYLKTGSGNEYNMHFDKWTIKEEGPLYVKAVCRGRLAGCEEAAKENESTEAGMYNKADDSAEAESMENARDERYITFECTIEMYAGKSEIEVSFRLINSTDELLHVAALEFAVLSKEAEGKRPDTSLVYDRNVEVDSTGCGDLKKSSHAEENVYRTTGIKDLPDIETAADVKNIRTCAGRSNYKTNFIIGKDGKAVEQIVDGDSLIQEANEHFAEVFYGTFFADRTDAEGGICATIYQAQQNFPKAVKADRDGIYVMLVPENVDRVEMESGMSRTQKFLLHFHEASESLTEIDNISLMYQMKDRPYIMPEVFKEAGVMPDIFPEADEMRPEVEISLIGKCDGHGRSYGMMCFGDTPDMNYTTQGRGRGMLVWSNNEYDFPHACAMQYARTGERRFLDYVIAAAVHWMDVDVCHYSRNPLELGGQWEHTRRHVKDGLMVCSHEWVEGLLDYYHFTGDERGLETAIGIGNNVLGLLELPMYQKAGESNARETGWALRTLVALYVETNDKKWLGKCEWIVGQFEKWQEDYGNWLATYTDNTLIRVGFMISVAIGSLMRYYRVFPSEKLKRTLVDAVDDLVENGMLPCGLFYYKELPSLNRLGNNALLLEAMAAGYELTGDKKYLEKGLATFSGTVAAKSGVQNGPKHRIEDAVLTNGDSTKNFAQTFLPMTLFYVAAAREGLI